MTISFRTGVEAEEALPAEKWEELAEAAKQVADKAYAPYSHFRVGAALLGEDGVIYLGCNVENASYGATSCAERTSIGTSVAAGNRRFKAIAIYNSSDKWAAPCGICRQVLSEFCPDLPMLLICEGKSRIFTMLDAVLPFRFSSSSL